MVVLNAAGKCGRVEHEPGAEGERTPDIFFRSLDDSVRFIADVATVSDRGFNKDNPVDAFDEEFWRHLQKFELSLAGGFHRQIDRHPESGSRGSSRKVRVKLPPPGEFDTKIFNAAFFNFLRGVKGQPNAHIGSTQSVVTSAFT